jgi:hypothetical protein
MLKVLAKGLFGRVLGYAGILLGFWLLFQGFSKPNPALGVLGGASILGAMWLMVAGHKQDPVPQMARSTNEEEADPIDPIDGCKQGGKLPP